MTMTDNRPAETQKTTETERVADDLLRRINAGEFTPGQSLPSVNDLIAEYRSTMAPVRSALTELAFLGVIDTRPGQTARVRQRRREVRRYGTRANWEKARAIHWDDRVRGATGATEHATGLTKDELIFDITYDTVKLDADMATLFEMPVGEPALRRNYHTMAAADRGTLGMSTSHLLIVDVEGYPPLLDAENEPWPGATMHQLRMVGIEVGNVEDVSTVRAPTIAERDTMGMRRGELVVQTRKMMWDIEGKVVEVAHTVLPADSAKLIYEMELDRWPDSHNDEVEAAIRLRRKGRRING